MTIAIVPGLILTSLIAIATTQVASRLQFSLISPVTLTLLIGIIIGNAVRLPTVFNPGIDYSIRNLLRFSIILLGFRLTIQDLAQIGLPALSVDLFIIGSTFLFSVWISRKVFGLESALSYLIAAGCSICGASAILAAAPIVKSQSQHNIIAVGIVTVFGTISMVGYPFLYKAGILTGFDEQMFGVFVGASIHEVGQVVSAGFSVSEQSGNTATLVKLVRVLMLAPVLIALNWFLNFRQQRKKGDSPQFEIPGFVVAFMVVVAINSTKLISSGVKNIAGHIGLFCLLLAMTGMGLKTHLGKIRGIGFRPFYAAALISVFLFAMGWGATRLVFE